MGLKIFTIILVLFVAELTFLATKEPKKLNIKKSKILTSDVEFLNISGGTIDQNGIKNRIVASKAIKYQTYNELYDLKATFEDINLTHKIQAKKALFKDHNITLTKDVLYENNQSTKISSQKLEYNTKTKVASTNTPFELSIDDAIISGDAFSYDLNKRYIKAKKPHFIQEVDER